MLNIDLSGKTAVITGGTGQLGREMVRTLAAAGANIAIHYRQNVTKAQELLQEIEQPGVCGLAVQAEITEFESVLAMRDKIHASLGKVDIVVSSAVIKYPWRNVLDQSPEDYESQFRSNVLHNVFMAKAFVPAMIQQRWGRMISINTECAMQCYPNQSAYVSGKRGMDGVLRVLAKEVGEHNVTVNQVAPGWMISEDRPESSASEQYRQGVPMKHRGHAQEIANLVAFLASDLAGFITGAYIPVCGGNIMPAI